MNQLGAPDPIYVEARSTLLDAFTALEIHLDAIVLVGAQAVYIHAQETNLSIAPFTSDGDLAIDPRRLGNAPLIEIALQNASFRREPGKVGVWSSSAQSNSNVVIDLLVPESLGGDGRRGARIPPHAANSARKVTGLEPTLVDNDLHIIGALDPADLRKVSVKVAGPAALLVAKVYKIMDREVNTGRLRDKDALDIFRLLQAVETDNLKMRFSVLKNDQIAAAITNRALEDLPRLFGTPNSVGCQMVRRAVGQSEIGATVEASLSSLTGDLMAALM